MLSKMDAINLRHENRDHNRFSLQFVRILLMHLQFTAQRQHRRMRRLHHLGRVRRRRFEQRQNNQRQNFIMFLVMAGAAQEMHNGLANPRRMWAKRRLRNYWEEVYHGDLWEASDWRENLRMSRGTFEIICEQLSPYIEKQDTRLRRPVPHHERLAVTLWKLATVMEYRSLEQKFGLGRSTVSTIVHDTCRAICEILRPIYIKFPTGERLNGIVQGYDRTWGFPQCVGAIDGMHVPIKAPHINPADYYNRKFYHSVVLQGTCDFNYRFIDIYFGFAGRAHDAKILANSGLYKMAISGQLLPDQPRVIANHNVPLLIIGDPAYPLLPWLMKPFAHRGHLTAAQNRFNYRLSRARMTIENTFGRLKSRWRCLLKKSDFQLENVHHIVTACCVLHNVCEIHNERFNPNWRAILAEYEDDDPLVMEDQVVDATQLNVNAANATRDALVRFLNH
ncbi:uncharacterized protein LOC135497207 [Lineus longissimus]|uniref:uncharacterized protein LOC135497207 n=1 Tax=Lineus longissimus TaxID=88925 RepID=UPI00315DC4D1